MDALCHLKGVGPATASLIAAAMDPQLWPFLSDEAVEVFDLGKPEYTTKFYQRFRKAMLDRVEREEWRDLEQLEQACWSWVVLSNFEPEAAKGAKRKASEGDATGRAASNSKKKTKI